MLFRLFESLIDPFRNAPDGPPPAGLLRFYAWHLRQVWPVFAALLVVGFFVALIEVAMFAFIGRIVDMAATTPAASFFAEHGRTLTWMALLVLVARPLLNALHDLLLNQAVSPGLANRVRWQSHRHVLGQSLGFFQGDFAGRIANRIMQSGAALRESASQVVEAIWYVTVYTGSAIWLFADADWRLTVPIAIWIVAYLATLWIFVPRIKTRAADGSVARSRLMGRIVDGYTNIMTLKLFAHSEQEAAYAREAVAETAARHRRMTRAISGMDVTVSTLNGLLVTATTGFALWLWSIGSVSVGAIALTTGLVIRIINMSGWIMWVVNGIFENVGTVQDSLETIAPARTVVDRPEARALVVARGEVRFEQATFHYGRTGGVIEGLDLHVRPGEKIGLVGPSGAGKTTLMNLLLRLYDLEGGRILIDGQDIAGVTQDSLRAQIGVVTQDTSLLHRSIRENLLYGRPGADMAALERALVDARADAFVPALVDSEGRTGLDAQVGERGVKLSGGQRQRIAIARVLLKNAPILVLDEATSALDSEVEAAIQDGLDRLMQGKTVIAIAHRLSTIARMDRLVVMEHGRIVETGTHAELLAHGGLYARLWARQTGGFVAAEDAG